MKTYPPTKDMITAVQKEGKSIVRTASNILSTNKKLEGVVLDIGAGKANPGAYHRFFNSKNIKKKICIDLVTSEEPDVIGDAGILPIKSKTIDTIICFNLIEHVPDPFKTITEISRVMKKGAKGYFFAPYLTSLHTEPPLYAWDYSRLSHQSWKYICKLLFSKHTVYPVAFGPCTQIITLGDFLIPAYIRKFMMVLSLRIDEWLISRKPHLGGKFLLGVYVEVIK